jgi:cyclic nucleotide-binding protein
VRAVDEIAFKRLDRRLAEKLLELADAQGVVVTTHQELSVELGSAREVISRQLRVFREKGWVAVARGKVRILNAMALSQLA